MKTILHFKFALIFCLLMPFFSNAQFTDYERDTKWNFGMNMGGVWQDGDIKLNRPGFGYGFTLGKGIYEHPSKFWSVDLRFRYLKGRTFGQNLLLTDSSNIEDNSVFATNPTNYKNTLGFTFYNTETALHDFSMEAVLNFHALREKTGLLLSVFGGIGITDYRTKTNLRDDDNLNKIYNYLSLDTSNVSKSQLRDIQDGSYESFAPFSEDKTVKFMPSLGVGLGYQITPEVSLGFEHRVTFTLQDKFDGLQQPGTQFLQWGDNDKYHYSSVFLRWNIFRGESSSTTSSKNCPPPYVKISDLPEVYEVNEAKLSIKARVSKIKSNNDVILVVNDQVEQTEYNQNTDYVTGVVSLIEGTNKVYFIASNSCGESIDSVTIIYNPDFCPKTRIVFAESIKDTVYSKNLYVNANVSRLQGGTLNMKVNNNVVIHTLKNNVITAGVILIQGSNTISINSSNKCGDTTVIKEVVYLCLPPSVSISTPNNGKVYTNAALKFQATAKNIDEKNQVSVTFNGNSMPVSFSRTTGKITSNLNLRLGSNTVTVAVANDCGNETKTVSFLYEEPCLLPVVNITSPQNGANVSTPSVTVRGTVSRITNSNSVSMLVNGVQVNPYFNSSNGSFSTNVNLRKGSNTIEVTGLNNCGQDKKSIIVNYNCPKPTISISSPQNGSSTSNSSVTVRGNVSNVASKNEISVTLNGVGVPISFNQSNGTFSGNIILRTGLNTIVASVTNACGSASGSVTISYAAPCPKPSVSIASPANGSSTSSSSVVLSGTAVNIASQSDMRITLNGVSQSFSWNSSNKVYTASLSLRQGSNTILVSANTNCGSDSKSITVNHNVSCPPPAVSISNPSNGTSVASALVNVAGYAANVSSKSQIQVKLNGVSKGFNYNSGSKSFSANLTLVPGNNVILVTATTNCGSDSKTVNVVYNKACPAPTVSISTPRNGTNATSLTVPFTGVVGNIQNASDITLKLNGVSVPKSFNSSTGIVTATLTIRSGGNSIELSASNNCGSDSKSTSVSYKCPLPTVNIASPNNGMRYTTGSVNYSGFVSGISSKSQIKLTLNGGAISFNYDTRTSKFSGSMNMKEGTNTLVATVTNSCGTSTKSVKVTYTKPCPKPVVTITSPASGSSPVDQFITINGTTQHVTSKSQLSLTLNGVAIPFTFNASSNTFKANYDLTAGKNTIVATATNSCGTSSNTITLNWSPPCPKPGVTISSPKNGASYPAPTVQVVGTTVNVSSKSQMQVKLNGANVPFTYNTSTKGFSATINLRSGQNTVVVTATTPCGTDSKSISLSYAAPCPKPSVSISSPRSGANISGNKVTVSGSFANLQSKSDMQIKLNGVNQKFTFSISSGKFSASLVLRSGSNSIVVTGSTNCGTDTKSISVTSTQIIKPIINVYTPNVDTSVVNSNQVTLTGDVQKITGQSKFTITVNGKSFTKYSFNKSGNEQYIFDGTLSLNSGVNIVVIRAVHATGGVEVKTKVITVNNQIKMPDPKTNTTTPSKGVTKPTRTPRIR